MSAPTPNIFLCNEADRPASVSHDTKITALSYLKTVPNKNVNLKLPKFIDQVYTLPDRLLDLLEIAAYIFAADRHALRGSKDAIEFNAWMRSMHFSIRVRDADFWNRPQVKKSLSEALVFMTGDRKYEFEFTPGHSTPPTSLFDREDFIIEQPHDPVSIVLFSGGLDSLAGVLYCLKNTSGHIYLISHASGQPSTKHTQKCLFDALKRKYPGRVYHYVFECGLSGVRAAEETQRTRAFLFGSIAFALAYRFKQSELFAYENGITSLNLRRRQDLINARASRTTHPKTHFLMSQFLSCFKEDGQFKVSNPFWQHTKTDVFQLLNEVGGRDFISSAVSCSKTFQRVETSTHCGGCFQCIDRRLAAYASGLSDVDNSGIYSKDIFSNPIESNETKTTAIDYIRQAVAFATSTDDAFAREHLDDLTDIIGYIDSKGEQDAFDKLWGLCNRHGKQIIESIKAIRHKHDDPRYQVQTGSLLNLIGDREYLKSDPHILADQIAAMLSESIPIAYKTQKPKNENAFNDQIDALLRAEDERFAREFPSTTFALAKVVPDHEAHNAGLLIEAKYIRKGTTPSKASEGIAADITKFSFSKFILFVVYDPDRRITDDATFKKDIENKRACLVAIIR